MKKIIFKILLLLLITISMFCVNTYAAQLQNLSINLNKTTINPGENVVVTVNFGQNLGAFTFDFAYDKDLLEFVSASDGAVSDNSTRVRVVFPNGGTTPAEKLIVTFKAKTGITTSKTTQIGVTAEGLANANASEVFDDITTPITKQLTIVPLEEEPAKTEEPVATESPKESKKDETPKVLPKTGSNIYQVGFSLIAILALMYVYISKKR